MTPVTDWFPGEVKPVRVGWWERKIPFSFDLQSGCMTTRTYWDGSKWDSQYQSLPWRGLVEEAK
jgi:hypothetical protein